jgi:hypothetical protein
MAREHSSACRLFWRHDPIYTEKVAGQTQTWPSYLQSDLEKLNSWRSIQWQIYFLLKKEMKTGAVAANSSISAFLKLPAVIDFFTSLHSAIGE